MRVAQSLAVSFHSLTIDHRVIAHHGLVGARGRGTRPRNRPFSRSGRADALPEREKRSCSWRADGPPNLPDQCSLFKHERALGVTLTWIACFAMILTSARL